MRAYMLLKEKRLEGGVDIPERRESTNTAQYGEYAILRSVTLLMHKGCAKSYTEH
jgi:hypothetical protein